MLFDKLVGVLFGERACYDVFKPKNMLFFY